jgi:tRNA dimethylallyltransferase
VLADRIAARVRSMITHGWVDEVRRLERCVPADAPAWSASGYGIMRRLARGDLSEREAVERVTIETRQYAKRQRTWFRHQLPDEHVTRVNPDDPAADAVADAWWRGEVVG